MLQPKQKKFSVGKGQELLRWKTTLKDHAEIFPLQCVHDFTVFPSFFYRRISLPWCGFPSSIGVVLTTKLLQNSFLFCGNGPRRVGMEAHHLEFCDFAVEVWKEVDDGDLVMRLDYKVTQPHITLDELVFRIPYVSSPHSSPFCPFFCALDPLQCPCPVLCFLSSFLYGGMLC